MSVHSQERINALLPCGGMIAGIINTAVWLLTTYDGYWHRVYELEDEIIQYYLDKNEEVIRA